MPTSSLRCLMVLGLAPLPLLAQAPEIKPAEAQATVTQAAPKAAEPFAFADFTWLNGNPRTKDAVFDSKYFTGEFRADVNAVYSFNHPQDHTLVGSCETGRTNEIQVQQLGLGGDFH